MGNISEGEQYKTEPKQALYEIRETIDDWWDKRIITNHTEYKMLRKLVEKRCMEIER